jgi:glutamine synthetase
VIEPALQAAWQSRICSSQVGELVQAEQPRLLLQRKQLEEFGPRLGYDLGVQVAAHVLKHLRQLEIALRLLDELDELKEVLGPGFVRAYKAVKSHEFEAFNKVISSWEREYLLLNV